MLPSLRRSWRLFRPIPVLRHPSRPLSSVSGAYLKLVESQTLHLDPSQLELAEAMNGLHTELSEYAPPHIEDFEAHAIARVREEKRERLVRELKLAQEEARDPTRAQLNPHIDSPEALQAYIEDEERRKVAREDRTRLLADKDWCGVGEDSENFYREDSYLDERAIDVPQYMRLKSKEDINLSLEEDRSAPPAPLPEKPGRPPRGIYIYGDVGTGKSMLMDLFYNNAVVAGDRKRRVHFHNFMSDIVHQMHKVQSKSSAEQKEKYDHSLLQPLAKSIAKQSILLCFDEVQIPDIGTAAILYRLFRYLDEYGVVIAATSNRHPRELYQGHFRQTLFDPFVAMLEDRCDIYELQSSTDYRGIIHGSSQVSYFTPLNEETSGILDSKWESLTGSSAVGSRDLRVFGRSLHIPECTDDGVARLHFSYLCDEATLGPADFNEIAKNFHTIFLEGIPELNVVKKNEARRLITLVDALYETKTKLYCTAARTPDKLFNQGKDETKEGSNEMSIMQQEMLGELDYEMKYGESIRSSQIFTGAEEVYAFQRCVSRLKEMDSEMYFQQEHNPAASSSGFDISMLEFGSGSERGDTATRMPEFDEKKSDKPRFSAKHFMGGSLFQRISERLLKT